jgi:hypothetical protein
MTIRSSVESDVARVQPEILFLSALLVPILTAAFVMIYLFPEQVGADHFAWPMTPLMSSMMLGATYLGGAYFFMVVLLSRQWRHVWLGFLPVTVFAATLGITTLLHWDRFAHDRVAFQLWAFLYFSVPFILPVLWYRNLRLASGVGSGPDRSLPLVFRWIYGFLGAVLALAGILLFLFPEGMLPTWPWTITVLTARVMAAIFILPGLVGLSIAFKGSWSSARYLLQAQAFTILLMLIAVYVAHADFDWSRPVSWVFTSGLAGVLLLILLTYLSMRE